MIRVAHVMGKMNGGGVEQVVMNYYSHIDRSEIQFDFLVDEDSAMIPRAAIEQLGGRVFLIPPYQQIVRYSKHLKGLFSQEGWRIVHSHINALSVFPLRAAMDAGVPVRIAHAHSTAGAGEPIKNLAKAILKRFSNRYLTHRFACSQYAGSWLFGGNVPFNILPNAVELDRFRYDSRARAEVREELGLSARNLVIGHVGRFAVQKNHMFLVDIFFKILEQEPEARLLLLGEGKLKQRVFEKVSALGLTDSVMFLGQRIDVQRYYQAFDCFVLPSLYEGCPVVAIEALASKLPCFLSEEVVIDPGLERGMEFIPLGRASDWVDAILRHPLNTASNRASGPILLPDGYDINIAADGLAKKYKSLEKGSRY